MDDDYGDSVFAFLTPKNLKNSVLLGCNLDCFMRRIFFFQDDIDSLSLVIGHLKLDLVLLSTENITLTL